MERVKPRSHTCKSKSRLNLSFKKVKTRFLSSDGMEKLEFLGAIMGICWAMGLSEDYKTSKEIASK